MNIKKFTALLLSVMLVLSSLLFAGATTYHYGGAQPDMNLNFFIDSSKVSSSVFTRMNFVVEYNEEKMGENHRDLFDLKETWDVIIKDAQTPIEEAPLTLERDDSDSNILRVRFSLDCEQGADLSFDKPFLSLTLRSGFTSNFLDYYTEGDVLGIDGKNYAGKDIVCESLILPDGPTQPVDIPLTVENPCFPHEKVGYVDYYRWTDKTDTSVVSRNIPENASIKLADYEIFERTLTHNNALEGASYDIATNTLTLENVNEPESRLILDDMGDLTLVVKGDCSLGAIGSDSSLNIQGDGTLKVNEDKKHDYAVFFDCNGKAVNLNLGSEVKLELYSKVSALVFYHIDEEDGTKIVTCDNGQSVSLKGGVDADNYMMNADLYAPCFRINHPENPHSYLLVKKQGDTEGIYTAEIEETDSGKIYIIKRRVYCKEQKRYYSDPYFGSGYGQLTFTEEEFENSLFYLYKQGGKTQELVIKGDEEIQYYFIKTDYSPTLYARDSSNQLYSLTKIEELSTSRRPVFKFNEAVSDENIKLDQLPIYVGVTGEHGLICNFELNETEFIYPDPQAAQTPTQPATQASTDEPTVAPTESPTGGHTVCPTAPTKKPEVKTTKKTNPMTVKVAGKAVRYKKVKKARQIVLPITVKKSQGKLVFKKLSGSSKLAINSKGMIVVKKGTKKGLYKIRVRITAKGNTKYKSKTKTVIVKVRVK